MLELFGGASGLRVNDGKSMATLIRFAPEEAAPAIALLACPVA
jgi:hypothetical protein